MRRIKKRHAALGMLMTGMLTVGSGFVLENTAGADPVFDHEGYDAHLKDQHHGASFSDVEFFNDIESSECDAYDPPEGAPFGWHFILPGNPNVLPNLTAVFASVDGVTVTGGHASNGDTGKGWYVYSATGGTLADAVADTDGSPADPLVMVLSHTCGPTGSSSSSSSVSSSSESSSSESSSSESSSSESSSSESSSSESSSSEVSSSSTSQTTSTTQTSSSQSSSSEESSSEESSSEESSSPEVSGSSQVNSSTPTDPASSPQVSGVQVPRTLPRTGIDPGFLLMLGGMFLVSGVLLMRYADDMA